MHVGTLCSFITRRPCDVNVLPKHKLSVSLYINIPTGHYTDISEHGKDLDDIECEPTEPDPDPVERDPEQIVTRFRIRGK